MTKIPVPFFVLFQEGLGYLTFKSYCTASASLFPQPSGYFLRKKDAERRLNRAFYVKNKLFDGTQLEIRKIELSWELI